MAIKKLRTFLNTATLVPKYAFSTGKVSIPTIMSVVVNAEITINETPFCFRIPPSGNAINPGIMVIEPKSEAIRMPIYLLPFDKYFEIRVSGIKKSTSETKISTKIIGVKILINFFRAIFSPSSVLFLSKINENKTRIAVMITK